jgi:hypothetical protein
MSLCDVCVILNPELTENEEARLGEYNDMSKRADSGCRGCEFFCTIIRNSYRWKDRLNELPGHIVFLNSLRLDIRAPDEIDGRSYSSDDLLFDICTAEGVIGMLLSASYLVLLKLIMCRSES